MQAIVFHILSHGNIPLEHISLFSPFYEINKTWNTENDEIDNKYIENHNLLGWRVFNTHLIPNMLPQYNKLNNELNNELNNKLNNVSVRPVRYIYVYRNAKDVCVSFFHHLSNQIGDGGLCEELNIHQFIVDWSTGELPYGSWIRHLRNWFDKIEKNKIDNNNDILLVKYEDLINDFSTQLQKISVFLDQNLTEIRLNELTTQLSFEEMKKNKKLYEPISVNWKDGFNFLRKGVIGDSKLHFTEDDEILLNNMLEKEFPEGIPDWFTELNTI